MCQRVSSGVESTLNEENVQVTDRFRIDIVVGHAVRRCSLCLDYVVVADLNGHFSNAMLFSSKN